MTQQLSIATLVTQVERSPTGIAVGPIIDTLRVDAVPSAAMSFIVILRGWHHTDDRQPLAVNVKRPDGTMAPYESPDMNEPAQVWPVVEGIEWFEIAWTLTLSVDAVGLWWIGIIQNGLEAVQIPLLVARREARH